MKATQRFLPGFLVGSILLSLLWSHAFGRTLTYQEMTAIRGNTCCDELDTQYDCKDDNGSAAGGSTNTCVKCYDSTSPTAPTACPTEGIKYSTRTYDKCSTDGEGFTCTDNGNENCYKNCDCIGDEPPIDDKECSTGNDCTVDDGTKECRACIADTCDASWVTKPDKACN